MKRTWFFNAVLGLLLGGALSSPAQERVSDGLQALYDFRSTDGSLVEDRSGVGEPLNLNIEDRSAVRRSEGALEIKRETIVRTDGPATRLLEALKESNALTVEAWIRPSELEQSGPARIITLSENSVTRNVTLGQDNTQFDARLRTSKTDANGLPSLATKESSLDTVATHVVFTRDPDGKTRLFLNGKESASGEAQGNLKPWGNYGFALGNELSGGRPWLGT